MRHEAIYNTHSTVTHIFSENEAYDKDDKLVNIDESKVEIELTRLQSAYDAQAYARKRASAYPSVGDQLDMMMKDKRDGTTTHQTACEAVKTQFPKG
jgi:hypothetical protein